MSIQAIEAKVEYDYEVTGQPTRVPRDNHAKLAYYLSCLRNYMKDKIDSKLTKYKKYDSFSSEIKDAIVELCTLLSPDDLEGEIIQKVNKDDLIRLKKPNSSNAFVEIKEKASLALLGLDEDGVFGLNLGEIKTTDRMLYTEKWIRENYYEPLKNVTKARSKRVTLPVEDISKTSSEESPEPLKIPSRKSQCCNIF